jgi:hypothetical protein
MINQQILDYIKQQVQQGVSREQIKSSLMTNGWQSADVEEAFNLINTQGRLSQSDIAQQPKSFNKTALLAVIAIGVLVIGGGVVGYFAFMGGDKAVVPPSSVSFNPPPTETPVSTPTPTTIETPVTATPPPVIIKPTPTITPKPTPSQTNPTPTPTTIETPVTATPPPVIIKPTPTITPKPTPSQTNPTPPPTTSSVSSKIDSCRTISTAGDYSITGDLMNTKSEPCIKIQNVSNVTLDCQNHTITSKNENYNIYVKAGTNFKLNNCKLISSVSLPSASVQHVLRIEDSKQGEVNNNTAGGNYVSISGSSFVTVKNSTFTNQLNVYKSNNITLRDNNFSNGLDPITLQEGNNNSVISNFIDGKSDGVFRGDGNSVGADDGIVIKDEIGDTIQGNTLQNFWDCAIENVGKMFDAKIIGNKASNAGVCFLGGWYYSSVKGIVVKDNVVSNMPNLFYFFRQYSLKPTEQTVYFQNNTFENNKLSNPKLDTSFSMASRFVFDGSAVPLQNHILGNNILRNNDFTKSLGPLRVAPANIIVDGGGNICSGAEEEAKGGGDSIPFNCN